MPFSGPTGVLTVPLVASLLLSVLPVTFLTIYVLGRAAPRPADVPDDQFGVKVVLWLVISASGQLVVLGAALLGQGLLGEPAGGQQGLQPAGLALGGLLSGLPAARLYATRVFGPGDVARQAAGVNALVTGLVFATSITAACVGWLAHARELAGPAAFSGVYFLAHVVCVWALERERRR